MGAAPGPTELAVGHGTACSYQPAVAGGICTTASSEGVSSRFLSCHPPRPVVSTRTASPGSSATFVPSEALTTISPLSRTRV